ncbi:hypothetical protein [Hyphomicrobium sp. ghe19]|uniref:hypothetical protein n=1 Tax=Hyphomicrobium sp. ghe19 TaxID=2682968 RepID=UPI00136680BA|nr:hypothetical protein HYPP_02518 [Hyphomicrobium sp. ghe19]
MLTDPVNTLAYHQSRVLCQHRDMSTVPCASVAKALVEFKSKDKNPNTTPESQALWFYGMNHAVALVASRRAPLEPLTPDELNLVRTYHEKMNEKAVRAFYYLLLTTIRESRHNQSKAKSKPDMKKQFGEEVAEFFCGSTGDEGTIHQTFLNKPPQASIGALTGAMQWAFYNSKWASSYGGPKWGAITDCLHRFVTGEYSAEMMLDTIWTLQHNGGVLFNKGHVFAHETGTLKRILDIQRSGQIPHAILYDQPCGHYVTDGLLQHMEMAQQMFPDHVGKYVDWYMVEALGSVHKYPKEISAQTKTHGISKEASKAQKMQAEKLAAMAKAEAEKKAAEEKMYFTLMPNTKVKKVEIHRVAEAA